MELYEIIISLAATFLVWLYGTVQKIGKMQSKLNRAISVENIAPPQVYMRISLGMRLTSSAEPQSCYAEGCYWCHAKLLYRIPDEDDQLRHPTQCVGMREKKRFAMDVRG